MLLGQAGALVASLATLKLLASVLSAATFGTFNLVLVATILPSWLFVSPLTQALLRWYAPHNEQGAVGDLLYTVFVANASVTTLVGLIASFPVFLAGSNPYGLERSETFLVIGIFLVESWSALALSVANAARRRGVVAAVSAATPWLRLLGMVVGIHLQGASLPTTLGGYLLGSIASVLYTISSLKSEVRRAGSGKFRPRLLKAMLAYGAPFGAWSIFGWAQNYADRYVVNAALGAATVGSYVATLQVASMPLNLLGGLLGQFLGPIVYQRAGDGTDSRRLDAAKSICTRMSVIFFLGGLPVVGLLAVGGSSLVRIVASERFVIDSGWICGLFALGALLAGVAQLLSLLMLAQGRSGAVLWTKVVPGLVGLPIVLVLTNALGLIGSAIGYALTALTFLLSALVASRVLSRDHDEV